MKLKLVFIFLFTFPFLAISQGQEKFTKVKTRTAEVKIPGEWKQLNTMDESGQTYLKNEKYVIIAIAQNPKKTYSFHKPEKSDFKNVKAFYKWDSDYRKQMKQKTDKIKENAELEYVIWKFNDGKLDNVFLFGSVKNNFLNLLVYTSQWNEDEKIKFLEATYKLNRDE